MCKTDFYVRLHRPSTGSKMRAKVTIKTPAPVPMIAGNVEAIGQVLVQVTAVEYPGWQIACFGPWDDKKSGSST